MTLRRPYHDHIQVVDAALKSIFFAVQSVPELQAMREQWASSDVVWHNETPLIPFGEGMQMLRSDGRDIEEGGSLSTQDGIRLGELVKQTYMTDYYILVKVPVNALPFYTHAAEGPQWTYPFVVFLRGQEICQGGQRLQDPQKLWKSMEYWQSTGAGRDKYLTGFDPHEPATGGASICLDHLIMALL
jgi:aspartyl-tRNA synthetase